MAEGTYDGFSYDEPPGFVDELFSDQAEIDRLSRELEELPDKLREHGRLAHELDYEYARVRLLKSTELSDLGFKVTFINSNIDGYEEVGLAKLKARLAQVDVEADKEEINVKKLRLRVLNDQMARDYGRPSNT